MKQMDVTRKCIRCLELPAEVYAGHVITKGGEKLLAGWCKKCLRENPGFSGHWRRKMGRKCK